MRFPFGLSSGRTGDKHGERTRRAGAADTKSWGRRAPEAGGVIRLRDREIAFRIARSDRRKTIGLRVDEHGLLVRLPAHVPDHEARRAIREKSDWVLRALERWAETDWPVPLQGETGEPVGWLGGTLPLQLEPWDKARTKVVRERSCIRVHLDGGLDPALRTGALVAALKRWRKAEALRLFTPRVAHYADALGRSAPKVLIREQKARWGSCSSDGVIRLNARLIAHAPDLIDYVCAHEACHLVEMNHSKAFHDLLESLMPEHRELSRRLRSTPLPGAAY